MPLGSSFHAFAGISIFKDIMVANEWTWNIFPWSTYPTNQKVEQAQYQINMDDYKQLTPLSVRLLLSHPILCRFP